MKLSKNLPIYVLSLSLIYVGTTSAAQAATQYLTLKQYKADQAAFAIGYQKDMKAISKDIGRALTATGSVRSELYSFIGCYNVHSGVC